MNRTNLIALCIALLLCCIAAVARSETSVTSTQPGSASAGNSASSSGAGTAASPEQINKLEARLDRYFTDYRNAQWRFSWAYHICIYGAAILSALAALLSKARLKVFGLEDPARRDNWTASLAAVAALLIAISSAGKLQESWQENMSKRYDVESLVNQLAAEQNPTSEELEAYGKRLALIIDPHTVLVDPRNVCPKK
ncbi:MAG TPA: hypothetical protein VHU19_16955 [Pyrinomonadaceae bacterium]|jgi:hypothetical protein|nr:hypothetical protein [Pyrinomonadaceae bacterium]